MGPDGFTMTAAHQSGEQLVERRPQGWPGRRATGGDGRGHHVEIPHRPQGTTKAPHASPGLARGPRIEGRSPEIEDCHETTRGHPHLVDRVGVGLAPGAPGGLLERAHARGEIRRCLPRRRSVCEEACAMMPAAPSGHGTLRRGIRSWRGPTLPTAGSR
jgi:hypothetical protein